MTDYSVTVIAIAVVMMVIALFKPKQVILTTIAFVLVGMVTLTILIAMNGEPS